MGHFAKTVSKVLVTYYVLKSTQIPTLIGMAQPLHYQVVTSWMSD